MESGITNANLILMSFGACLFIGLGILIVFAIKRDLQEKKKYEGQLKEPRKVA